MKRLLFASSAFALAACSTAEAWAPLPSAAAANAGLHAGPAATNGSGDYAVGVIPVTFSYTAIQANRNYPNANGRFRQSLVLNGLSVDFEARVTCVAVDEGTGRAWVGGVVTANHSENPSFQTPIHQVGRDVWFRVVDYGEGAHATQPDRITFLGFEGGAGIITSAEYCATRPWPAADARTNAVINGNIQVH